MKNGQNKVFSNEEIRYLLKEILSILKHEKSKKAVILYLSLIYISNNADDFDENCQINLFWLQNAAKDTLECFIKYENQREEFLNKTYTIIFRCCLEYNLLRFEEIPDPLNDLLNFTRNNLDLFDENSIHQIEYAIKWMPVNVAKKILNSPNIEKYLQCYSKHQEIEKTIDDWDSSLEKKQQEVENLKSTLEKYENAFNFVGLYKGFDDLHKTKIKEYSWSKRFTIALAIFTMVPLSHKIYVGNIGKISAADLPQFLFNLIPYFAITFLIIYFF